MKFLVIGGTGMVGSQVVRELAGRGHNVRVLTRHPEKLAGAPPAVEAVRGDLLDIETIRTVFKGADGVFMLNPVSPTETHEGLLAVNGMKLAGIPRVVYMSVQDVDRAPYLPHFGAKLPIETAIRDSSMEWTILRPNNFFQNDYMLKDAILGYGVYPQPIGDVGVGRVDVRDIAELAAIALTKPGHKGHIYNVVGPHNYTGDSTARVWGEVLDRPVIYGGNDLDAWEKQMVQFMPAWMVFDFKLMYAFFAEKGLRANTDDIEHLTDILGHVPRNFEAFARETAALWKS